VDRKSWDPLSWTRSVKGVDGDLAALASSSATTKLDLIDLHGDIVATTPGSSDTVTMENTGTSDEFGAPAITTNQRFGWMGAKQRQTQLSSGVIQMGVRLYVPQIGRFTSTDPVSGGSLNAYDYSAADPVCKSDPSGMRPGDPPPFAWNTCNYATMRHNPKRTKWCVNLVKDRYNSPKFEDLGGGDSH
jgi:RHS repeat-associated protein